MSDCLYIFGGATHLTLELLLVFSPSNEYSFVSRVNIYINVLGFLAARLLNKSAVYNNIYYVLCISILLSIVIFFAVFPPLNLASFSYFRFSSVTPERENTKCPAHIALLLAV